jgi:GntR family transcriptional regulator
LNSGYVAAVIDSSADRALYRRIADELRKRIEAGVYPPGTRFRSEEDIRQEWGVARVTARAAMRLLEQDGLITIRHGQPTRVRDTQEMSTVPVRVDGSTIGARPAKPAEAAEWGIPEGYPMLTLHDPVNGAELEAWPADRTRLRPEAD